MTDFLSRGKRFDVPKHDSLQTDVDFRSVTRRVESMVQEYRRQRSRDPDLGVPLSPIEPHAAGRIIKIRTRRSQPQWDCLRHAFYASSR